MLGFFELHLKDKGRGAPMALASFTTLPPEDLMAFKPGKRPAEVHSLAEYAVKRGNELKKTKPYPQGDRCKKSRCRPRQPPFFAF